MVKLGTRVNEVYYCLKCGIKDESKQSLRYVSKDAQIFILNCANCRTKVVVTILKEQENKS